MNTDNRIIRDGEYNPDDFEEDNDKLESEDIISEEDLEFINSMEKKDGNN